MFLDRIIRSAHRSLKSYSVPLSYLKSRCVTEDDIDRFLIGYSKVISILDDGTEDFKRFSKEMWNGKKCEEKLLFPIQDSVGNITGIVCRSLDIKNYKIWTYDVLGQTGFFFGLYQALPHIYETGVAFVVEGTFDAIALSSIYPNVVASLTSGLNDNQYELLKFYCKTIILMLDSDKPGRVGVEKIIKKHDDIIDVDIGYKDMSKCRSSFDLESFRKYISRKVNIFARKA